MRIGSRGFVGATVIAAASLLGAAVTAQAPASPEKPVITDEVFKSVVLLRGIPVDAFFEAMGMFASAMGNDCTFCHVSRAYFDKAAFAEATPRIQRARQMIVMMNAINKQYFGGQPRVTCFTCHAGTWAPRSEPDIALQYGVPTDDPNAKDFPTDARIVPKQVFDKYVQALGGAERLAKFTSYTATGTYTGFDTGLTAVPVELYAKAPAQHAMVVQMDAGVSTRTFDGVNGWMAGPDTPLPLLVLSGGNLDRARLEGMVAFPSRLAQAYPEWRGGRTGIDDKEVLVIQGLEGGQPQANFYFDESGLLVRLVRWTATPVGLVPTQIDFSDYRDVGGLRVPFRRIVSQTYMQMTVELTDIRPNTSIDPSRFAKPSPVVRRPG